MLQDPVNNLRNELETRRLIEDLKENWKKDPCWDIEDTEGFESHREELLAWRKEYEAQREEKWRQREQARREHVLDVTGINSADNDLLDSLFTWSEIENTLHEQGHFIDSLSSRAEIVMAELATAQVRATILQAAQLKRIADALENIDDGDSLIRSAQIWGSEQ